MGTAVFLYQNYADTATLSGGSWLSALPLTNLQDPDLGRVARSSDPLAASTLININLGQVRTFGGVVAGPTNASAGSVFRVRAYSDAAMTIATYDSGLQTIAGSVIDWSDPNAWLEWEDPNFWLGAPDTDDVDFPLYLAIVLPADILSQYVKLEIIDLANQDGYIELGRLIVGRAYRPAHNYSEDNALSLDFVQDVVETLSGRRIVHERGMRRKFRCAFPNMDQDEAFDQAFKVGYRARISRQVFVIPNPDDTLRARVRWFLATMVEAPAIAQMISGADAPRASTVFDFIEEVR